MDDFLCSLTCGYRVKYNVLKDKTDGSICWLCKTHPLDIQACLNMPFSQMNKKQKEFDLEMESFFNKKKSFDSYTVDLDFLIGESLAQVKYDLDLKREELKTITLKKIDEWFFELSKIVDNEYILKKKTFLDQLESLKLFEQDIKQNKNIEKFEPNVKLNFLEEKLVDLKNKIELMNTAISDLVQPTLEFFPYQMEIDNFFGQIKKDISEAKIELTIENFSQFISNGQVSIFSESCFVRNLEWNIRACTNLVNEKKYLSVFINGYGNEDVKKWKVNLNAEIRILNLADSLKDRKLPLNRLMSSDISSLGYTSFISILELENPGINFYDIKNDCVKVEVQLKLDKPSFTYL